MSSTEQTLEPFGMPRDAAPGWLDRLARAMISRSFTALTHGCVTLLESGQRLVFGDASTDLAATVRVHHPSFYRQVAFGGTIGAGEAYMDGAWECDDLPALVRIMVRNQEAQARLEGGLARLAVPVRRLLHRLRDNTRPGSRRNIAAHYDVGNPFYRLFLDPTMTYSCGIFEHPDRSMEEASVAKLDRICRKLRLEPGMSLLEIGTGWGSFAIHAARNYGCCVTTTTISCQQHELAEQRVREAGLDGRVTLLLQDYRDLGGQFDRITSIEMIEAVGHRHLPTFFQVLAQRLKPDGIGLIQAITMPDYAYDAYKDTPDFISYYIFPGGCCPSLTAMSQAAAATDLRLVHLEDITPHYPRTLRAWRSTFHSNLDQVRQLGYPERFIRMWDFYLCHCIGGFEECFTRVQQLLYARPGARLEPPLPALA